MTTIATLIPSLRSRPQTDATFEKEKAYLMIWNYHFLFCFPNFFMVHETLNYDCILYKMVYKTLIDFLHAPKMRSLIPAVCAAKHSRKNVYGCYTLIVQSVDYLTSNLNQ